MISNHLLKLPVLPLLYSLTLWITSVVVFFKRPSFRLTKASPATTAWLTLLLFVDSLYLWAGLYHYQRNAPSFKFMF